MTIINMENKLDESALKHVVSQWKGVLSEFVATALLIYFGCISTSPIDETTSNPPMYTPIAFGLTVMFNIQIFGHLSGAYMNPFVTIAAVIWGRITVLTGILFIIAECAGAIVGYGLLMTMAPVDVAGDGLCLTVPHSGINDLQALGIEIILTMALSLINCAVWDPVNAHNLDSAPLKFGFTIIGLSIAGGPLTGASMNPARSLGPAVWANRWDSHWVYWVGPLVGGILPAIFYKYVWLQKTDPKVQN